MDRLTALASFVRICELGSFSAAAQDFGLSQPSISQQIRGLEAHLGVRLFNRTTRHVTLTDAGVTYLERARDVLERLDEADRIIGGLDQAMSGRLAISAPVGLGSTVLVNFFMEFKRTYPDLVLDISLSDSFVDVVAERFDVAIRLGTISDERLIVRRLGIVERCLAAAPDYLARKGKPQHPTDLTEHEYIIHSQQVAGGTLPLTGPKGERVDVPVRPTFCTDNALLMREALVAGVGIGLMHRKLFDPLLANQRLEYVLPKWRYAPHQVHAVYPSNRYIPLKVRRFVDGLVTYLQANAAFACTDRDRELT
jgi:DNA-binding transcriptional LysR family regulator